MWQSGSVLDSNRADALHYGPAYRANDDREDAFIMIPMRLFIGPATALSFAALDMGLSFAMAETIIFGTPEDVKIVANHADTEELLSGLREKFEFSYRSRAPIDQTFDGTYEGPLRRVVRQLLKNYDYVLKSENGKLIIDVINQPKTAAQPNSSSPPPLQRIAMTAGARNDLADGQSAGRSSALGTMMKLQATSAVGPISITSKPTSSDASASTLPPQAEMAQAFQRANSNLQALNSALSRLMPPPLPVVSSASPAPAASSASPASATSTAPPAPAASSASRPPAASSASPAPAPK